MFFKKKKVMSHKSTKNNTNNHNTNTESTDNLSQNEGVNEVLSNEAGNEGEENEKALVEEDSEKAKKLEAELNEMRDKHLRLVAEFDNFRRRNAKERMELSQTAGKEVIQSLLVVMDDVERAAKQLETATDVTLIKEGVSLVFNKLRNILQQKGLKVMEAANQEFNPDLHEAITEVPAPNEEMKGKIIDVVEQGYYLNEKLIRHAKVVVGK
jgi:molecular chaperone GrpE